MNQELGVNSNKSTYRKLSVIPVEVHDDLEGQPSHTGGEVNDILKNAPIGSPLAGILNRISPDFANGKVNVFNVASSAFPTSVLTSTKGENIFFPGDITYAQKDLTDFGGSPRGFKTFSPKNFSIENDILEIFIRPSDDGWIMGDDWIIKVHREMRINDIRQIVEGYKNIPANRQKVSHIRNNRKLDVINEDWSLRRLGFVDGDGVVIEPTMKNTWLWNSIDYYEQKFINDILKLIDNNGGRLLLKELESKIERPPPIDITYHSFIRKFPEKIYMYTDVTHSEKWITRQQNDDLPSFGSMPMQLGGVAPIEFPSFNFSEYADIDDTKPLELDFAIPNVRYKLQISRIVDLRPSGPDATLPNPMCIAYFNGQEIGRTLPRVKTLNPEWNDAIFELEVSPNQNIFNCTLLIEVCDSSIDEGGNFVKASDVGYIELSASALENFMCGLTQESFSYKITNHSSNSVLGTITMKSGKTGFEVKVLSAFNLPEPSDTNTQIIAIILWNGEEIGRTSPDAKRIKNPLWNETFTIPLRYEPFPLSDEFLNDLRDCIMEVQVWTVLSNNIDEKVEFIGNNVLKSDYLVDALSSPTALLLRNPLQKPFQSSKKSPKFQKISGNLSLAVGPSGLNIKRGYPLELAILAAEELIKIEYLFYTVEWNYSLIYRSNHIQLTKSDTYSNAEINNKCLLEVDNDTHDLSKSYLKIEFFESIPSKGYTTYGEYMGCVKLEGQKILKTLFTTDYASINVFDLLTNDDIEKSRQSLIHGRIKLRSGMYGSRTPSERILIVYSCSNLDVSSVETNACVVIYVSGKEIGRTSYIKDVNPVWDRENIFYVDIQHVLFAKESSSAKQQGQVVNIEVEVCQFTSDNNKVVIASSKLDPVLIGVILQSQEPLERKFNLKPAMKLRLPSGVEPQIKIGSCGSKYPSISSYKDNLNKAMMDEATKRRRALIKNDSKINF